VKLNYSYFAANEGGYIGFFDNYPDWWTEGDTLEELEDMLLSSYSDFNDIMTPENTKKNLIPSPLSHGSIEIAAAPAQAHTWELGVGLLSNTAHRLQGLDYTRKN